MCAGRTPRDAARAIDDRADFVHRQMDLPLVLVRLDELANRGFQPRMLDDARRDAIAWCAARRTSAQ